MYHLLYISDLCNYPGWQYSFQKVSNGPGWDLALIMHHPPWDHTHHCWNAADPTVVNNPGMKVGMDTAQTNTKWFHVLSKATKHSPSITISWYSSSVTLLYEFVHISLVVIFDIHCTVGSHLSKHAGTKGCSHINWKAHISETILFVYKAKCFPFNAQQNIYEYH